MKSIINKIIESKSWDKLLKELDANMKRYEQNKKMATDTMITFKQLEKKLKDAIEKSDRTIGSDA